MSPSRRRHRQQIVRVAPLRLTPREREVLVLWTEGLNMDQIADRCAVAATTIRQRGKDACHRNHKPSIRDLSEAWTAGAPVEVIGYEEARRLARERRQALQQERGVL